MTMHRIRSFSLSLCLVALTLSVAEARPMSTRMYCDDVRGMIARHGSVVVGYTAHTYDRIVRDRGFCLPTEVTEPINVPTLDTPYCPAGFLCKEGGGFRRR